MGEQLAQIKNALIKEKFKIHFSKMSKKEISLFKWNQFIKAFTHLFYFTIISFLFGFGWKYLLSSNNLNIVQNIQQKTVLIGYGIGHFMTELMQAIIGYNGRLKFNKKVMDINDNPEIKKTITNKLFLLLSIIPLLIWLLGYFFIWLHFKPNKKNYIN